MPGVDDAQQILNLIGTYCDRMDGADWEGVGALFADAALADEHGHVIARGAEQVAAFYRKGTKLHDGSPRTKHLVTNSVVELDGDTAVVRSSYLVLQATADRPLAPIITGRYVDTFRRPDDGWAWAERRFLVDLLGDLSEHLTFDVT
jgi:ketosteroid isomerase-like protein